MINQIEVGVCSDEVVNLMSSKGADIHLLSHRYGEITHDMAKEWIRINFGIHIYVGCKEKDNGQILYIACGRTIPFTKDDKGIIIDCIPYNPKNTLKEANEFGLLHVLNKMLS